MTCYIFICINRDMVRGGRSRTVSSSVGRGSASPSMTGTASPSTPVVPATGTASPSTPVVPATGTTTMGKIDPSAASRYITTLVHTHIPGPVDAWREFPVHVRDLLFDMFTRRFAFTRPEDLPRARAV
ncbi:hypothetical protein Taro_055902 [Colocasia esculenta]|uniref:Uncharacterized protein n=1 Tax=Colocasia esculenta TaxID=4460 RepID=A0A843XSI4_COLES|nr:hypothetical protein [Colocasia esculenta]